ncbi:MAG: T9SS type A sorting domain-containing protein [Bacteroidia bacterium]
MRYVFGRLGLSGVVIKDNNIYDFTRGIFLAGFGNHPSIEISNNHLEDAHLTSGNYSGTAISVQNFSYPVKFSAPVLILNNTIINPRIGIHLLNVMAAQVGTESLYNTITYSLTATPTITDIHSGIWLQNSPLTHVVGSGNSSFPNISNDAAVTTSVPKFRGIEVENSRGCKINCNVVKNINQSIFFTGGCDYTLMRHNIMLEYEYAVYKNNAFLSRQGHFVSGTTYEPLNNEWYDAGSSNRVDGTGFAVLWDYDANNVSVFQPAPANPTQVTPIAGGTVTVPCDEYGNRQSRDDMLGPVVGDSLPYRDFIDENSYLAKTNAYWQMLEDSTLLDEGDDHKDSIYQAFFDTMAASNIGAFINVTRLLFDSNYISTATSINSAIDDTNSIESYKKIVNNFYLTTLALGNELSEDDSAALNEISELSWVTAGDAIYMAAYMIGKEIHPSVPSSLRIMNSEPSPKVNSENSVLINLFPNPASDFFVINAQGTLVKIIYIYDLEGRLLYNKINRDNIIPCSSFQPGVYLVKLVDSDGKDYFRKIHIIK